MKAKATHLTPTRGSTRELTVEVRSEEVIRTHGGVTHTQKKFSKTVTRIDSYEGAHNPFALDDEMKMIEAEVING